MKDTTIFVGPYSILRQTELSKVQQVAAVVRTKYRVFLPAGNVLLHLPGPTVETVLRAFIIWKIT